MEDSKTDSIFSYHGSIIDRKCSDVSYIKNLPVTELLQNEEIDFMFDKERIEQQENESESEKEFIFEDLQVSLQYWFQSKCCSEHPYDIHATSF